MTTVVIREDIKDTLIPVSIIGRDEDLASFHINETHVGREEFPAQIIQFVDMVEIPDGYTPVVLKSGKLGILESIDLEWEHPTRQFQITS